MRGVSGAGLALLTLFALLLSPWEGGPAAGLEGRFEQSFENEFMRGPQDAFHRTSVGTRLQLGFLGLRLTGTFARLEEFHREKLYLNRVWATREVGLQAESPAGIVLTLWERDARYPGKPSEDYKARRWTAATKLTRESLTGKGEITVANWCLPYKTQRSRGGAAWRLNLTLTAARDGDRSGAAVKGGLSGLSCVSAEDPGRDEDRSELALAWTLKGPAGTAELAFSRSTRFFPHNPSRDELGLDRSLKIGFPTAGAEVTLLASLSDTVRPNKPALTQRFRRLRGTLEREFFGWQLALRLTQDTTRYPNDPVKDKQVYAMLVQAERALGPWTLGASLEHRQTVFPNNPLRDELFRKGTVTAGWTRGPVSLTFALEARDTRFPNDPLKDVGRLRAEFELAVEPRQDVSVSLQGEWVRTRFPNDPAKDTTTTFLALKARVGF